MRDKILVIILALVLSMSLASAVIQQVFFDNFDDGVAWTYWTETAGTGWQSSTTACGHTAGAYGGSGSGACAESGASDNLTLTTALDLTSYGDCILTYQTLVDSSFDNGESLFVRVTNSGGAFTNIYSCTNGQACENGAWTGQTYNITSGVGLNNNFKIMATAHLNDNAEEAGFDHVNVTCSYTDSIKPLVSIVYPQNTTYNTDVTELNYSVSDANLQSCWYSLNNGVTNASVACGTNLSGLSSSEGSNTWRVWANDSSNNVNASVITFIKDTAGDSFVVNLNETITISQNYQRNAKLLKGSIQEIALAPAQGKEGRLQKGLLQGFNLASFSAKIGSLNSRITQTFSLGDALSRLAGLFRINTNTINIDGSTSRFTGLFKLPSDLFTLNILNAKSYATSRAAMQDISLNEIVSRIFGSLRFTSDLFNFNIFTNRNLGAGRSSSDSLTINSIQGRISNIFKVNFDILNLNNAVFRIRGLILSPSEILDLNDVILRFANMFRISYLQASFTDTITKLSTGISRYIINVFQNVDLEAVSSRMVLLFRSIFDFAQIIVNSVFGTGHLSVDSPGSGNGGSGSGGGGGSSSTGAAISDKESTFEVNPEKLLISLKQGETTNRIIQIKNLNDAPIIIKLELDNLDDFLVLKKTEYIIPEGESKDIFLEFIARESTTPDSYLGRIVINYNGLEQEIFIVIDVSSKKPLLDVKTEVANKNSIVSPGEILLAKVELFNFGELPRVDVKVEYSLKNFFGEVVISEEETLAVETQATFIKEFKIPSFISPGTYVFNVKSTYSDGSKEFVASSSACVFVEETNLIGSLLNKLSTVDIISVIILITLILIGVFYSGRKSSHWKSNQKIRYFIILAIISALGLALGYNQDLFQTGRAIFEGTSEKTNIIALIILLTLIYLLIRNRRKISSFIRHIKNKFTRHPDSSIKSLINKEVYTSDGNKIGKVKDVYFEGIKPRIYGLLVKLNRNIGCYKPTKNFLIKRSQISGIKNIVIIDKTVLHFISSEDKL